MMGNSKSDRAENLILVIGIGNEFRSDDGLGVYVARELRHRLPEDIRVIEQSGECTSLMASWCGAIHVLIIDAVSSNETPGVIHRLDGIREGISKHLFRSSSHALGVVEAIEMARKLNTLPRTLTCYGIVAESFEPGVGLSESVVRSVPRLIHCIEQDLAKIAQILINPQLDDSVTAKLSRDASHS